MSGNIRLWSDIFKPISTTFRVGITSPHLLIGDPNCSRPSLPQMSPHKLKHSIIQRVSSFRRGIRRIRAFSKSIIHVASNSCSARTSGSRTGYQEPQEIRYYLDQFSFEKEDPSESPEDWFTSIEVVSGTHDAGFYHALTTDQPCLALQTLTGPTNSNPSETCARRDPLSVASNVESNTAKAPPQQRPLRFSRLPRKFQRWPCQRKRLEQQRPRKAKMCYFSTSRIPRPHKSLSRPRRYEPQNHLPERSRSKCRPSNWGTAATQVLRLTASPVSDEHTLFDYNLIPLNVRLSGSYDCLPFTKRRQHRRKSLANVFGAQPSQNPETESNMAALQSSNPESRRTRRHETSTKNEELSTDKISHTVPDSLSGSAEKERAIVSPIGNPLSITCTDTGQITPARKGYGNINPSRDSRLGSGVPMDQRSQQDTQANVGAASNNTNKLEDDQVEIPWVPPPPRSPLRPYPYFGSIMSPTKFQNQSISPEIESEREKALRRKCDSAVTTLSGTTSLAPTSASKEQPHVKLLDRRILPNQVNLGSRVRCPKKKLEVDSLISVPAGSRSSLLTEPPQNRVARQIVTKSGIAALTLSSASEGEICSVLSSPSRPGATQADGNSYADDLMKMSPYVTPSQGMPVNDQGQRLQSSSAHYVSVGDRRGDDLSGEDMCHSDTWKGKQPISNNFQNERSCSQTSVSSTVEEEENWRVSDTKMDFREAAKRQAIVPNSTLVSKNNQAPLIPANTQSEKEVHEAIKAMKHHGATALSHSPLLQVGAKADDIEGAVLVGTLHRDLKAPAPASSHSNEELGPTMSSLKSPSIGTRHTSYREQAVQLFFSSHPSPVTSGRPPLTVLTFPSLPIFEDGLSILAPRPHCGRPNPKLKSRWNRQRRIQEAGSYAVSPVAVSNRGSAVAPGLSSKRATHPPRSTLYAPYRASVRRSHQYAQNTLVPTLTRTSASPPSSPSSSSEETPCLSPSNIQILSLSNNPKSVSLLCPPSQGPRRINRAKEDMSMRVK